MYVYIYHNLYTAHSTILHVQAVIHTVLMSGLHKVILEHREDIDNLGLHLSGGLPPVTVTHIEPGGQSEKAGIKVGDILLNVNGLNCQEKVGIAQLMHLKLILKQDYIDVST